MDLERVFSTLLVGEPGVGKTTAACTAPSPVGVIDFDNKLHKMVNVQDKLERKEVVQIPINEPLSKIGLRRLATDKQDQGGSRVQQQPKGYLRFVEIVEQLEKDNFMWDGVRLRTIVLDSYTGMIEHIKRLLMTVNQKMTMTLPLYGTLLTNLEEVNNTFVRFPINVIMCAHQKIDKDELSGKINFLPLIEGQMAGKIGKDFEEVYYMVKDIKAGVAKYQMLTVGDNMRACRTSRKLQAIAEPDFCKIYNIPYLRKG